MPLISMTGFGRGEAGGAGVKVDVELSSVNRKQFEVRISLPKGWATLESRVYEVIHKSVRRGHVTGNVKVSMAGGPQRRVRVDTEAAAALIRDLRATAAALNLRDDLGASALASLPDLFVVEGVPEDAEPLWPIVQRALGHAVTDLRRMETVEGKALEKDVAGRVRRLERRLTRIRVQARRVVPRYRELLTERLARAGVEAEPDGQGLWKEIVVYADRCDVSEEVTRLQSHFAQARDLIGAHEPSGRALDFLCQEMFREINTIGSKANDATIASHVVHFKTDLEAMREQIQNVE